MKFKIGLLTVSDRPQLRAWVEATVSSQAVPAWLEVVHYSEPQPGPYDGLWTTRQRGPQSVPGRREAGCAWLFNTERCDLVTVWDDDDWSPHNRLERTVEEYYSARQWLDTPFHVPWVGGYVTGWFCNWRTLCGHAVDTQSWGVWGGTLTFNEAAWRLVGFDTCPFPGNDRAFVDRLRAMNVQPTVIDTVQKPVAFSHGNNHTTWLQQRGEDLAARLMEWLSPAEWSAFIDVQQWLLKRRIFPPQP